MTYFFQKYLTHLLFAGVLFNLVSLYILKKGNDVITQRGIYQKISINSAFEHIHEAITTNQCNIGSIILASRICPINGPVASGPTTTNTIYQRIDTVTVTKLLFNKLTNRLIIQNGTFTNGSIVTPLYDTLNISAKEARIIHKICQDYYLRQNKKNQNPLGI